VSQGCSESDAAVVPAGRMTWLECGNPLKRVDVVISLERMDRIVHFSPPDLTATVEAGLTLSEFSAVSVRERNGLPFDPPGLSRHPSEQLPRAIRAALSDWDSGRLVTM